MELPEIPVNQWPGALIVPLIATAVSALTLAAESIQPLPPLAMTPEIVEIIAHKTLRLYCILGAIGGGFIGIMLMTSSKVTPREMAAKWTTGVLSGLIFTPWLLRATGIPPYPDYILAASGAVSLMAWSLLGKLTPVIERLVIGRTRKLLGDKSDPSTPNGTPTTRFKM